MQKEINIRLNVNRAKAVHTGHKFASGDKGIVFKLAVDELDTTNTTAKIVFKRSNGTSVEAGITAEDGIYSYTTLGNEFAVVGQVTADVKFYEGEKRISTCTFVFEVVSDTLDGIGTGTGGYSDTLEKMKKEMEEILAQMKDVMDGAEEDVEAAEKKMADLTADLEALYQEYVEAFGSTGPFNPRGPYSETESYTVRDLVTYDDASWVCYRNCTGATPSKESDCWQYFAVGAEVNLDDIIDGTTQVGNAKTLDGHGADAFLKKSGDTVESDSYNIFGVKNTSDSGDSCTRYENGSGILGYLGVGASGKPFYKNGAQTENYLLIYSGNVSEYPASSIYGGEVLDGTGMTIPQLQEHISNWADSLTYHANAVLTIRLGFEWVKMWNEQDTTNPTGWGYVWNIHKLFIGAGADCMYLAVNENGVGYFLNRYTGIWSGVRQISTANDLLNYLPLSAKPTGTYTGNGSASFREVATGGIGNVIAISGSNNTKAIIIGTGGFAIGTNGNIYELPVGTVYMLNGLMTTATDDVAVNANGVTYTYHVL